MVQKSEHLKVDLSFSTHPWNETAIISAIWTIDGLSYQPVLASVKMDIGQKTSHLSVAVNFKCIVGELPFL